jgi:hypothetical protein
VIKPAYSSGVYSANWYNRSSQLALVISSPVSLQLKAGCHTFNNPKNRD